MSVVGAAVPEEPLPPTRLTLASDDDRRLRSAVAGAAEAADQTAGQETGRDDREPDADEPTPVRVEAPVGPARGAGRDDRRGGGRVVALSSGRGDRDEAGIGQVDLRGDGRGDGSRGGGGDGRLLGDVVARRDVRGLGHGGRRGDVGRGGVDPAARGVAAAALAHLLGGAVAAVAVVAGHGAVDRVQPLLDEHEGVLRRGLEGRDAQLPGTGLGHVHEVAPFAIGAQLLGGRAVLGVVRELQAEPDRADLVLVARVDLAVPVVALDRDLHPERGAVADLGLLAGGRREGDAGRVGQRRGGAEQGQGDGGQGQDLLEGLHVVFLPGTRCDFAAYRTHTACRSMFLLPIYLGKRVSAPTCLC